MSDPMNQHTGEARKTTEEKVAQIYDLIGMVISFLFKIFGKRKTDSP
jgi:hypothetical protein